MPDTAVAKPDLSILESQPPLEEAPAESTADLKKRTEKLMADSTAEAKKEAKREADPRAQKVYPFSFEWKDANGKTWKGDFQNTRLTIRQRQLMGVLQTQMSGGVPYSALDPMTQEINLMLSHMAVSLDEEKRPSWAKDLVDLDSFALLSALYGEVALHEAIFHGHGPAEKSSKESGQ